MKYMNENEKRQIICADAGTVVLLTAPVGSGKTTFCLQELRTHCRVKHQSMLLLVNRSTLRGQLRANIFREMGVCETDVLESGVLEVDGLTVTSYQYMQQLFAHVIDWTRLKIGAIKAADFSYVVADEIHYLLADSLFSPQTDYLLRLPKAFPKAVRVYMSATLQPVRGIILKMEEICDRYELCETELQYKLIPFRYSQTGLQRMIMGEGEQCKRDVIEIQAAEPDFTYFDPIIYEENDNLTELIKSKFQASDFGKWLVFVESKEIGRAMKAELIRSGISSAFVAADGMEEEDTEEKERILKIGRFNAQVLLATTVLDNGISITDNAVTHLAIAGYEQIEMVQQAGRIRLKSHKRKIQLYICNHTAEYFNRRLFSFKKRLRLAEIFKTGSEKKILDYLIRNGNDGAELLVYKNYGQNWHLNSLAIDALNYVCKELAHNIRLAKSGPDGYVSKVLGWFDLPYNSGTNLRKEKQNAAKNTLLEFLRKNEKTTMSGQQWDEFRQNFRRLYEEESGTKLCSGREERFVGVAKIRELLTEFGYLLEATHKVYVIKEA